MGVNGNTPADTPEVLWRMQGPTKVVSAALFRRVSEGTELRVFFEPDTSGDLLSSQFEKRQYRVRLLEERAGRLREALQEQGWVPLPLPASNGQRPPEEGHIVGRIFKAGAIGLGLIAVAGWGWHRSARRKPDAEQSPKTQGSAVSIKRSPRGGTAP